MSSLSQCVNGHFFDSELYEKCPYCKDPTSPIRMTITPIMVDDDPPEPLDDPPQCVYCPPVIKHVVGWLVAIEGPYRGKSFELHVGYNTIGRREGDIKLEKDYTVAGRDCCRIVYDEEDNRFIFFSGMSDNYPRVNGEKKYPGERADLKPYDTIKIGESSFHFIPYCSENIKWGMNG